MSTKSVEVMAKSRFALSLIAAAASLAQIAWPGVAHAAEPALDEVTVTATRREESLQDVPVSVSVLSGDELGVMGVLNSTDLAAKIPNVEFANTGPLPVFAIRGVQLLEILALGNEPPVAMYFDDVYVGTLAGQSAQIFDIDNVQVVRGPQGTLFGRNSTGGLVQYLSRRPTQDLDAYLSLRGGDYGQRVVEGAVSGPLSPRVRARLAASYNEDDGFQRNLAAAGGRFASTDTVAARLLSEFDLTDDATLLVNLNGSQSRNQSALYGSYGRLDPTTRLPCAAADTFAGQCVNRDGFGSIPKPTEGYTEQSDLPTNIDAFGGSATLTWDLGFGEFVSVTSYDEFERFYAEDVDGSAAARFLATYYEDAEQFTQEFRISGEAGRSKYVLGAYYYNDARQTSFELPQLIATLVPILGPVGGTAGLRNRADVDTESWAVFGQTDYAFSNSWTGTLGLRYTSETKSLFMSDNPDEPLNPLLAIITDDISDDVVTGTVGLSWRPTDDALLYGTMSRGYKSGVFNTRGGVYSTLYARGFVPNVAVGPEEATAFELGVKSEFADGRVRLNTSVFYTDYENLQVTAVDRSIPDVLLSNLVNAGDAEIVGGEIEITAAPTSSWKLGLGVGLLDTKINSSTSINGLPLDGNELPKAPKWSLNATVRYDVPATVAGGKLGLQGELKMQDDEWTSPENIPEEHQDGYQVANFRVLWESQSGRYSGSLFLENAFDEEYWTFNFQSFDYVAANWQRPRWWGASFTMRY